MSRFIKNRSKLMGQAPGSLVFVGNKKMEKPRFRLISYSSKSIVEHECETMAELLSKLKPDCNNWINIDGIHDVQTISNLGTHFGLSPLVLEDVMNTDQRPKLIEEDKHMICYLKQLSLSNDGRNIKSDQISLIIGTNYLISIQEKVGTYFDSIRNRIRKQTGKVLDSKPDYLFYRILDTIADNYLMCIETLGTSIEENEEYILSKINQSIIEEIYRHKTEISFIRKAVRPVKEITSALKKTESELIQTDTEKYINDLDDIVTHTLESIDVYYSMIGDQLNIYNTNLSNRANDVMKVLTVFAAIFIPLTFIAGVYGTNFEYLPELGFHYSYFIMWGVMIAVAIVMLFYFKRKKWF